jgi:hypothetical protein
MIKITLGKSLEERKATCAFCEETNKDCIKGVLPFKTWVKTTEFKPVIDDWNYSMFSSRKYIEGDVHYREVVVSKELKVIGHSDICKDCIKQLAKLI